VASDQSQTLFLSPTSLPPNGTLSLVDQGARIRGITVVNSSTADVWLFFSKQPNQQPDVVVAAGNAVGIPVASAQYVAYAFVQTSGAQSGYCYFHITTDLVSSTSSVVTIALGATGYGPNGYTTFSNGIILQWGGTTVMGHDGSGTFTFATPFGTTVYAVVARAEDTSVTDEIVGIEVTSTSLTAITFNILGGLVGHSYNVTFLVVGI
jgi:hypothetical protein